MSTWISPSLPQVLCSNETLAEKVSLTILYKMMSYAHNSIYPYPPSQNSSLTIMSYFLTVFFSTLDHKLQESRNIICGVCCCILVPGQLLVHG